MAKELPQIETQPRERVGTRYARRIREQGQLPAVIYGHGQGTVSVSVDYDRFFELLHGGSQLIEVKVDDAAEPCLVKDVQWNHLGTRLVHADLTRVDLTEEVEVEIDVVLNGEPPALEQAGAILDHPLTTVTVRCQANNIPDVIRHDISDLGTEEPVTAGDLAMPEGVVLVTDEDAVIAHIQIMEELPEEEAAGVDEEPEVIGRGGAEEEDEDADDEAQE